jgi:hypothetical protein
VKPRRLWPALVELRAGSVRFQTKQCCRETTVGDDAGFVAFEKGVRDFDVRADDGACRERPASPSAPGRRRVLPAAAWGRMTNRTSVLRKSGHRRGPLAPIKQTSVRTRPRNAREDRARKAKGDDVVRHGRSVRSYPAWAAARRSGERSQSGVTRLHPDFRSRRPAEFILRSSCDNPS